MQQENSFDLILLCENAVKFPPSLLTFFKEETTKRNNSVNAHRYTSHSRDISISRVYTYTRRNFSHLLLSSCHVEISLTWRGKILWERRELAEKIFTWHASEKFAELSSIFQIRSSVQNFQLVSSVRPLMFAWFPWSPVSCFIFSNCIKEQAETKKRRQKKLWNQKKKKIITEKRIFEKEKKIDPPKNWIVEVSLRKKGTIEFVDL